MPPVPTMVCLFAGGGGLFSGFKAAGFKALFATDSWKPARDTFERNSPDVRFHLGDIRRLTPEAVHELTGGAEVDVVVGGPPCQGFSTLGDQVQGDPRNSLAQAYARIVKWTRAKCLLMENTSYLRSQYSGQYEREIRDMLGMLGYRVDVKTLNAADYGVPQIRKRVFFFGTRLDLPFAWPVPTFGPVGSGLPPYLTVGSAIMDLADVAAHQDVANHLPLKHSATVLARYRLIPEGGRLPPPQELPVEIRRRNFGNTYKRLHRDRPSLTLVPGNNAFPVHPTEERSLTPREAARLQTFPDDYIFVGSRAEQCKLIGNAVPVRLGENIALSIRNHMESRARQIEGHCNTPSVPEQQILPLAVSRVPRRKNAPSKNLTGLSFFSGAGGLLLGFQRAGFDILAAFDRRTVVSKNHVVNFPNVPYYQQDIMEATADDVRALIGGRSVDVVFGGPPCQGFSIFGKRRFVTTRGHRPEDDPRNQLTLKYISLAIGLRPRMILMENVKGLLSTPLGDRLYLDEVLSMLGAAGYTVEFRLVNSADYGVPQLRERVLLVAMLPGIEFLWPKIKFFANPKSWQRPYLTVGDVIADLQDPATISEEFSHLPMEHKTLVVERYKLIPEGGRLPDSQLPDHLKKGYRSDSVKNFSHVYRRLDRNKPATTMVPGHNAFPVHPVLHRTLTVREAARIQTFPDWMRFVGTRQQQCTLVGNAVPPLLAEVFAQAVVKSLKGNAQRPDYKADHYELKAAR